MDVDPHLAGLRPPFAKYARWGVVAAIALVSVFVATSLVRRAARAFTPRRAHVVRAYTPPFGVRRDAIATIDLPRVHAELFPRWVLAESDSSGSPTAVEAFALLRAEAGKDPNLDALLLALGRAAALSPGEERADKVEGLVSDWNHYLDAAGAAHRLELSVRSIKHKQTLYVKSYRVVSDVMADVGDKACRARLLRREDHLNIVEPYLGTTTSREEGAFVVLDRIRELGEGQVWALLDADNDPRLAPVERPFGASVRAEAERALPDVAFRALQRTAAPRSRLVKLAHEINARAKCGGELRLPPVPTNGYSEAVVEAARLAVVPADTPCATLTADEHAALASDSRALGVETALPAALDELDAWLARAVATHEARHAADGGVDGFSRPCPACPASLGQIGRAELSAYVTAMATDGIAYVSLYQACTGAIVGPSRDAVAVVATLLPGGCAGAPPADLVARAAAAELRWFARREAVVWKTVPSTTATPR
jgi:hypothetical protein